MRRSEALQVLQEIVKACGERVEITSFSIDETPSSGNFVVKVGSHLDDCSRNEVRSILDKHNLDMKESKGSIIIYSSHQP